MKQIVIITICIETNFLIGCASIIFRHTFSHISRLLVDKTGNQSHNNMMTDSVQVVIDTTEIKTCKTYLCRY